MTYLALYLVAIALIWWAYNVGWSEALKVFINVLIPSLLIIIFNVKAGRVIFRSPLIAIISFIPTALFIYRVCQPLVSAINNWIDRKVNEFIDAKEVIDAEVISKDDV